MSSVHAQRRESAQYRRAAGALAFAAEEGALTAAFAAAATCRSKMYTEGELRARALSNLSLNLKNAEPIAFDIDAIKNTLGYHDTQT